MKNQFVVTIGRQLGSGGYRIGQALAESLGISFYAKELLDIASQESGLSKEFFEHADEQPSSHFIGGFFGINLPFASEGLSLSNNCLCHDELFKQQSHVIREVAGRESALFMGRCADYILRDHPKLISIFIHASTQERVQRLVHRNHIDEDQAHHLIRKADKSRSAYYNFFSNKEWGVAESYDLCIDSGKMPDEEIVAFLKHYIELRLR